MNAITTDELTPEQTDVFAAGVEAITAGAANALARVVELPDTAAIARARFEESEVADRVRAIDGDAVADPLPQRHDVVLVANFIHLFSPETSSRFLANLARAVNPGARLLLVDFWTDPTHTSPPIAALLAGEFLLVSGEGDVYSHDDLDALLTEAGWQSIERRELAVPQSLVIAEASPRRR